MQQCDVTLESWGHQSNTLKFYWNTNDTKVNTEITLSQQTFQVAFLEDEASNFSTGSFSKIKMRIYLTRNLAFHALRTYLPSCLFILVAWFSMFVPLNHVPGKILRFQ